LSRPFRQAAGMSTKIAVAIVHGVGITAPDFAREMIGELSERFTDNTGMPAADGLAFQPVYWGPILQEREDELWKRVKKGGDLDFVSLRQFIVSFAADALAYQPLPGERSAYDEIHAEFARSLKLLAAAAGPEAPLAVISHSLGTVISSNYFYDLSRPLETGLHGPKTIKAQGETPGALERGETLAYFVTMGSPIALWSMRYKDFGRPISVPAPKLKQYYPELLKQAAWENYYDPDDVIGYPLKTLNAQYRVAVKSDNAINAGSMLTSWNPMSHVEYWADNDPTKPVAAGLAALWRAANH
jgi:hypothetical protein